MYTLTVVGIAGIVGFSSSVHTPAITAIAEDFDTSRQLSTLGATTYLIGSAFGPLIFAPLSEIW
jgi:MFS family permease